MKKIFVVANWKSNKTGSEAKEWLQQFSIFNFQFSISGKEVIVCPPFTLLPILKSYILNHKLNIRLGAQNVSPFDEGAYTGEINSKQLKDFADYVIIGHSERRISFAETDETLFKKNEIAKKNGLGTIYCVQGKEAKVPVNVDVVAYEPIDAIGTGHPDTPENANDVAAHFKINFKVPCVLYGGSVTAINVKNFTQMLDIDGVLIGKASLDAKEFYTIIKNA